MCQGKALVENSMRIRKKLQKTVRLSTILDTLTIALAITLINANRRLVSY